MPGWHGILLAALALLPGLGMAAGPLDLELPTLAGDRFFRLAEVSGRTVVINFWDTECPACIKEMPLLQDSTKAHPYVLVLGVALAPRNKTLDFLESHPLGYLQLSGPKDPSGLLRRFGDAMGLLPHTVVLGRDHANCASHTGEISRAWLDAALERCR